MPTSTRQLLIAAAAAAAAATALTITASAVPPLRTHANKEESKADEEIRAKLPFNLRTWRCPGTDEHTDDQVWLPLLSFFKKRGYTLWEHEWGLSLVPPEGSRTTSNGFAYATASRGLDVFYIFTRWEYMNSISRAARTRTGQDVIVRVIVVGEQGKNHLNILRKIARGRASLFSENHALPMLDELAFQDIVFAVFPKTGLTLDNAYGRWAQNSVGDIVNMIMQALEGLAFIHSMGIAHRDVFKSNLMIEWFPESMLTRAPAISHPRVYLIDFECAVEFPADCPPDERHCVGLPLGDTMPEAGYIRPVPPEIASGGAYDPFKLDVWQLGTDFGDIRFNVPAIDEVLAAMADANVSTRPSAEEALRALNTVVSEMPPKTLLVAPVQQPRVM